MPVTESSPKSASPVKNNVSEPEDGFEVDTVAVERVSLTEEETLPEDLLSTMAAQTVSSQKQEQATPSESLPDAPAPVVSAHQRRKLDAQIEELYERVAHELNDNGQDVAFALEKLRHAQDILLEDMQRFEEALYSVHVVNQMLIKKQNWRRWSYTWGLATLAYALLWLAVMAVLFVQVQDLRSAGASLMFSVLAGGLGGVVAILQDLSWHVSVRKDFDRQYLMKYLLQPIMGLVLGGVVFLISGAGLLMLNISGSTVTQSAAFAGGGLALQVLVSFVTGFRHQVIYDIVNNIVKRLNVNNLADNR